MKIKFIEEKLVNGELPWQRWSRLMKSHAQIVNMVREADAIFSPMLLCYYSISVSLCLVATLLKAIYTNNLEIIKKDILNNLNDHSLT